MRERLLKRERALRHRRTENEIFASYLSERFGAPSFRRNISTNFFVFKTRHRTSFGRINRKGGVLMLTEEYRLWDLWVRVYVKAAGEKKTGPGRGDLGGFRWGSAGTAAKGAAAESGGAADRTDHRCCDPGDLWKIEKVG